MEVVVPRIVVSAPRGKSGKTLVTTAILYALSSRGLRAAPFKVGPDYIDPTYHSSAAATRSRNLDEFLMGEEGVLRRFAAFSAGADLAVIEGVLGLYDSIDGVGDVGSTAKIAKMLRAPVILVMDADRVNRTLRAVLRGLMDFDPNVRIAGVIITNVSARQAEKLGRSFSEEPVPVLGMIPRDAELARFFEYRHLGLVPIPERGRDPGGVLMDRAVPYIDIDAIISIAKSAEPLRLRVPEMDDSVPRLGIEVGVFLDEAFTFYYPEVLEALHALGRVHYVDSVRHQSLPDVDLLVIGGGFPEVYAERLERNAALRSSLRRASEKGTRIYAECGGLMYLASSIVYREEEYEMVGVFDGVVVMTRRPVGHGYAVAEFVEDSPIADRGTVVRGHEFHYSKLYLRDGETKVVARLVRGAGMGDGRDGLLKGNVYAQYMHVHPASYNVFRVLAAKWLGAYT